MISPRINRSQAARLWLAPHAFAAAWFGLFLAIVTPPHGTGTTVCWIKAATGLPCPGCGLTRSMSCALHGMLAESWEYHPFGMFIFLVLLMLAAISVCSAGYKQTLREFIATRPGLFTSVYWGF